MQVFNLDEKEVNEIEQQRTGAISGNEPAAEADEEEEEDYEELGPPKKFQVNMMRIQRSSNDEPEIKIMISDIIAENLHKRTASADSATQASVLSMDNIDRCFNLKPCKGTIITATGATKGAIKFKGQTYFLGTAIDIYLADINCSVVAATVTCRKNNMQWVFGPGPRGRVHNFSTDQGFPLFLHEDMWPVPMSSFSREDEPMDPTSTPAKHHYNSSEVYTSKLPSKPKYNSFEVYTKNLAASQTTEVHVSNLASMSTPSTLDSAISYP